MHHLNGFWGYRGVAQHPYPPSAPPAQQNQVTNTTTQAAPATSALPYPHAAAANASSYPTPSSSYTAPATGYHPTAASSSTYAGQSPFQTSSQQTAGNSYNQSSATPLTNYASAVNTQRQQTVDPQVQQSNQRSTVAPGTPLSTAGSASYHTANNTSYDRNLSTANSTNQVQGSAQPTRQEERTTKNSSYNTPSAQSTPSLSKPTQANIAGAAAAAPKRKSMGRLGDADVHQAFYEFKNKETDKCMSAQCQYCHTVRAKNTSRQRQHLLECTNYLDYIREQNPSHHILKMAAQHAAGMSMKDIVKSNSGGSSSGGGGGGGGGSSGGGSASVNNPNNSSNNAVATVGSMTPVNGSMGTPNGHNLTNGTPTQPTKRQKTDHHDSSNLVVGGNLSSGSFVGSSVAPAHSLPVPKLERDFQLSIQLNVRNDIGKATWGQKFWTSYISGHWKGRWGKGIVVPGGQDIQNSIPNGSTQTESRLLLQTHDHPPAFISVKMEGWRIGHKDVLDRLMDPSSADTVDPREYTHRCFITIETGDARYTDLNTCMWLGSVVRKTTEVIYDAYKIS